MKEFNTKGKYTEEFIKKEMSKNGFNSFEINTYLLNLKRCKNEI